MTRYLLSGWAFGTLLMAVLTLGQANATELQSLNPTDDGSCAASTNGTICGRALAPDGTVTGGGTPITSSPIYQLVPDGTVDASATGCFTDGATGNFRCKCASTGTQTFQITSRLISFQFDATCTADQVTIVPYTTSRATIAAVSPMAIVVGQYDEIESALQEVFMCSTPNATSWMDECSKLKLFDNTGSSNGATSIMDGYLDPNASSPVPYQDYSALLKDPTELTPSKYNVVFLDCGLNEALWTDPAPSPNNAIENLRSYIEQGGFVYASDWAAMYLEAAFPELLSWYHPTDNTNDFSATPEYPSYTEWPGYYYFSNYSPPKAGNSMTQNARIHDENLATYLINKGYTVTGDSTNGYYADFSFPTAKWTVMTGTNSSDMTSLISSAGLNADKDSNPSTPDLDVYTDVDPDAFADIPSSQTIPITVSYCDPVSKGGFLITSFHIENGSSNAFTDDTMKFLAANSHNECLYNTTSASGSGGGTPSTPPSGGGSGGTPGSGGTDPGTGSTDPSAGGTGSTDPSTDPSSDGTDPSDPSTDPTTDPSSDPTTDGTEDPTDPSSDPVTDATDPGAESQDPDAAEGDDATDDDGSLSDVFNVNGGCSLVI